MLTPIKIRAASPDDLDAINQVIEAAIMTWNLPERVKRLSLPSYRYTGLDHKHLNMVVAENEANDIVGVAAWEEADPKDLPEDRRAVLLHGIYVEPKYHHQGIGQLLFEYVEQSIADLHYDGFLVKAQTDADGFFLAQGMQRLNISNEKRDYANRFWKRLNNF